MGRPSSGRPDSGHCRPLGPPPGLARPRLAPRKKRKEGGELGVPPPTSPVTFVPDPPPRSGQGEEAGSAAVTKAPPHGA